MSNPQYRQEIPLGAVAFGASALEVKTGLWRAMRPVIDGTKCISCLKCWIQCPDDSISLDEESRVCGIDLFYCKGCGVCEKVCPVGAISMHSEAEFEDDSSKEGTHPGEVASHVK
ncbi:MAG: 4Fe-4S binding protein [Synergistes sp.]|nr:4Fe-4S binding protein [Synergistes sp.]